MMLRLVALVLFLFAGVPAFAEECPVAEARQPLPEIAFFVEEKYGDLKPEQQESVALLFGDLYEMDDPALENLTMRLMASLVTAYHAFNEADSLIKRMEAERASGIAHASDEVLGGVKRVTSELLTVSTEWVAISVERSVLAGEKFVALEGNLDERTLELKRTMCVLDANSAVFTKVGENVGALIPFLAAGRIEYQY